MAHWIELTETSPRRAIFVNLDQASSLQRASGDMLTTIWFLADHPEGSVNVVETPEQIFSSARVLG
jgi:hypothetical protein